MSMRTARRAMRSLRRTVRMPKIDKVKVRIPLSTRAPSDPCASSAPNANPPKPEAKSPDKKIDFDFKARKFVGIKFSQAQYWQDCFPHVDIHDEIIRKMPLWIDANADKKRSEKNWKNFIVRWLENKEKYDKTGCSNQAKEPVPH